ncbi:hypothetical protein GF361_03545 [Candidatus Woesearchaeota archaeon]|nr:hypothetical protein [Candidatus Woesearchaeota archaeon]
MTFKSDKNTILSKIDKSKKGKIDKPIKSLIKKINKNSNFYTTSSCSGRIVLLSKPSAKKQDINWLFKSHKKISFKQINSALSPLPNSPVWFRFEPLILHITAKNLKNAQYLINKSRAIGFKRSGIQSTKNKTAVEIASTEIISTIIADKGKLLISKNYLKRLIKEANKKLNTNKDKTKKFIHILQEQN